MMTCLPTWPPWSNRKSGNYEEAKKQADVVISKRMLIEHVAAAAMENRGFVVNWDERNQEMIVWATTQSPLTIRGSIARALGLAESQVHVITPFIGGGFGPKVMSSQADDVLLPWISKTIETPDQMDRRPARELPGNHLRTRPGASLRNCPEKRWHHPWFQGCLLSQYRRI